LGVLANDALPGVVLFSRWDSPRKGDLLSPRVPEEVYCCDLPRVDGDAYLTFFGDLGSSFLDLSHRAEEPFLGLLGLTSPSKLVSLRVGVKIVYADSPGAWLGFMESCFSYSRDRLWLPMMIFFYVEMVVNSPQTRQRISLSRSHLGVFFGNGILEVDYEVFEAG
jgi:hypothetical protein